MFKYLSALAAAAALASFTLAPAVAADSMSAMPMSAEHGMPAGGDGHVFSGTPDLAATISLVKLGGGAENFSIAKALTAMVGAPLVTAEVGKLTKQYGKGAVGNWITVFDFSVGDKTFPAGVYSVTRVNQEKVMLRLSNEDGGESINIVTSPVQAKEYPKTGKLIFRRYGETYFLSQIWESDEIQGRQLLKSRTERSVERDLAKRGEGPSGEGPSIVDIVSTP